MKLGEQNATNKMDEYDKKFAEMQKYIPFLEAMIERLQNVKDKSREVQLQKMQSLHGILSNSKRKLKIETLQRCEDVLQKLHNKVEKGNTPGLHFPSKRSETSTGQASTSIKDENLEDSNSSKPPQLQKDVEEKETPASPSPPVTPDTGSQVAPIIIPTERSVDFIDDSKPASPDPIETLPTKAPIIIPTERTTNDLGLSPSSQNNASKNAEDVTFSEWEMLEESENQAVKSKNWPSVVASGHDVSAAIKLVGSNLPQKDSRSHVPLSMPSSRHIPTVPVPALGGSRRLSSVLEKSRLMGVSLDASDTRPESPVNVPDVRLKSPDPEILFPKHKSTSPRIKDAVPRPSSSKPSAPLLLSPPPVSTEPPLSMEDLAELLNEEGDGKTEKKVDTSWDEANKFKKQDSSSGKDSKTSKSFMLSSEDVDVESERRWEEIDKHIVKMTSRKNLAGGKVESLKSNETKGPSANSMHNSSTFSNTEKAVDTRNRPPSPSSKIEPRYADNYERHPRQQRDNKHGHDKDKTLAHCRSTDETMPNQIPIHHNAPAMPDERNALKYARLQGNIGPDMAPPRDTTECRADGLEYFSRQMPNQGHWPMTDFSSNQWTPTATFNAMPNSPAQPYQHPMGMHQEMWNVGTTPHMDAHQGNEGQFPGQFPGNMNTGIRPLMSPTTRPQDVNHIPRPDEMPNVEVPTVPTIQPLISPTRYTVGPQYRNFQGENRPYDSSFGAGMEYPHQRQSWDSSNPVNRPNEVPYRAEPEVPCVPTDVPQGPYSRPSTPCPWTRDRGGGRGRGGYYNDRNRGEARNNFNRDARRPDWSRDNHNEWDTCSRFGRDTRNVSERDPRVREHSTINQTPAQPRDNSTSVRDPRLAKDKHFLPAKGKDTGFSERDPRKRSNTPFSFRKAKEKVKSPPKPSDGHRRADGEKQQDKSAKDKMQSPLESLYGVIDTKAKSAQGYCLQNFKIPKIKRNESLESPTSSHVSEEAKAVDEKQEVKANRGGKEKDDTTAEVSSSSDGNLALEEWDVGGGLVDRIQEPRKEEDPSVEQVEEKIESNVGEPDSITTTSSKSAENVDKSKKEDVEPEGSKPKEEVTQEWIESLIRKSFEFGEGKKFVEQAKFMQKLGEVLQAKKLKKIKKIIESESESSSSDKDETAEVKKVQTRKKRRMIVSDSSDEESLADRLGILNTSKKESLQGSSAENCKTDTHKHAVEIVSDVESSDSKIPKAEATQDIPTETQNATQKDGPRDKEPDAKKAETVTIDTKDKIKNDEVADDKETNCRTPKAKARRRNSLEMLQEDIRDMFISDDVVAATGHRLCRTQKESQNSTSSSTQSLSSGKKEEVSKCDAEASSDPDESLLASSKQKKVVKSRSTDESLKLRSKSRKEPQRITRQRSKNYAQSSDSEEDQPLALRTELALSSSSLSTKESPNDDALRRSKRISSKEPIKEPRVVVEKTDISKLECTKTMFDSSSDESFGIDVSELAAAVDISLHPEKQSETEMGEPSTKKRSNQNSSKKMAKKKVSESAIETKGDSGLLSDDESIVSDVSMSSSVISGKKTNSGSIKMDNSANEELLSDMLVGLVPTKGDLDKDASMADKGSDADVDDDVSDQLPVGPSTKKSSVKKKKKKCNWQMGILVKKKRKKILASSVSSKCDTDIAKIDSEKETPKMSTLIPEDEMADENSSRNDANKNMSDKSKNSSKSADDFLTSHNSKDKEFVKVSPKSNETTTNDEKSKNIRNKQAEKDAYNLDINKLIDYVWTKQEKYKCLLCFFTGKNIVHHYKVSHPNKEILISRLTAADALLAIQDAKKNNLEGTPLKSSTQDTCKYSCRICPFFTEGATKAATEAFYEHCTTHTGEYRFRCNSCPYQTVAKTSMRTHYYKVCRKFKDNVNKAITEDEIPEKNRVCGYLCSSCNYIQLKKSNVEKHVELWHADNTETNIIKVNMSLNSVKDGPINVLANEKVKIEKSSDNLDESINDAIASVEQNDDKMGIEKNEAKEINVAETKVHKQEVLSDSQSDNDEKKKSSQLHGDSNLPIGNNLSVFVCPPELEKKEVEIQLERKRKMQEIIKNIGIKLKKDSCKKGLSIIDKLKDKMTADLISDGNDSTTVIDSPNKISTNSTASPNSTLFQNSVTESFADSNLSAIEYSDMNSSLPQEIFSNKESEDISQTESFNLMSDPLDTSAVDQSETMVKDPLATLNQKRIDESDVETSDNENTRSSVPIYESDSSSDQSDTEPLTDVNMILKETSTINASSKDPMLTTIQRLAAQLQGAKPIETCKDESFSNLVDATEKTSIPDSIPKPPDVVPISSIKHFVNKLQNKIHEILPETQDDDNTPKNFIRLRRLSGDMLSIPTLLGDQEDTSPTKNGENESSCHDSVLKTDSEEECSFLKIENVVSLAPRADNDNAESPIINDIRKAVETSPIKSKGVSVLKKSNSPLILKRVNAVTISQPITKTIQTIQSTTAETVKLISVKSLSTSPVTVTTTQLPTNFIPIAPKSKIIQVENKSLAFPLSVNNAVVTPVTTRTVTVGSSQSPNLNYKIVKVVRTPTILKPKDTATPPAATKLKSVDAYSAMLKTTKLTHLYKCMGRDCRFTTDVMEQYRLHYIQHMRDISKKKADFQKCAYCYMVLEDWNQMRIHIEEKHAHCRYQCSYCFYRAIAPSYVLVHQAISHSGSHGILLGKLIKEMPTTEEINRHDFVHPYVCKQDCGKFFYVPESFMGHLKAKHGSLSAFKCHICRTMCGKIEELITHYKAHSYHKYQCLYCFSGSDTFNDMHVHLSTFHCNRLPRALERSLPLRPIRNRDVIDQLIIRILDDGLKCTEEIIDLDSDGKGHKDAVIVDAVVTSPAPKILHPQILKDVNAQNKEETETPNKSTAILSGTNNSQITLNKSGIEITNKEVLDKSLSDASPKKTNASDKNCLDPIEVSRETFDCSDEFVNINVLDNPDFLKNVGSLSKNTSLVNNTNADDSKADDSDIEIVDIVDKGSNVMKDVKCAPDSIKDNILSMNENVKVDTSNQEIDTKEQSCSDVENSNVSSDNNGESSSSSTKRDKPLTLGDIKDTGFTGTKLYKCGYEGCDQGTQTAALLRSHVKECPHRSDIKNLNCAHCTKRFIKIGFLLEHLKLHGLKRFGCAFCKMRCTVGYQAMTHMKSKHKVTNSKLVPADPTNPSADGLFIVQAIQQSGERKGKKRKSLKSTEREGEKVVNDAEKLSFSPDEIDCLPRQAIYNRVVQCAVCPYTTKVRTNIMRHLLLHAKDESVPESGPVNPVPCLDKKERMFDKMVNLASSSHQNGRMGGKPKESNKSNDDEFIPKFVPEHKRYVCGVAECNYLTVDEAMLRCHLKALHSEEQYFRCPHCPQPPPGQEGLNIAIDKMGVHLKMHDTRLYKCSHCNHHHYHRHVVERHLSDKHPEKRPFVKVIRELENTENNQSVQEEVEEEVPDPDGNHWKCNICDYKCVYKAEMINHASSLHDEKCQFKCTLCSFKSSGKIMFEQHINSKHSHDPNVDYIMVYQRIKGINKKSGDNVEQSGQEEPFDTTPLWRRDMPRIRHIRGILLEEEDEVSPESKPGKRKSDTELLAPKPAKIKPGKSNSLDDTKLMKEKCKRSLSCDKVSTESEGSGEHSNATEKVKEDNDDADFGRFGPYGKPDGNMYVCTLCTQFKTKYKHDMRDHLYRELNYARWHCKECGYLSVNRNALLKHFTKRHNGERPNHEPLSPDDDIEDWVGTLLKRQTLMIKELIAKLNASTDSLKIVNVSGSPSKSPTIKTTQNNLSKSVKMTKVINNSADQQNVKAQDTEMDTSALDESTKDNEGLMDVDDEPPLKKEKIDHVETDEVGTEEDQDKPLICKHCKMTFARWRGFKLHVQLTHLKRLGFICPYCDRSTNSETLMLQHIRSKHPNCPEKLVQNPSAGGPELTDEFWEKEYGLVFPKKSKKRRRKLSEDHADNNKSQDQSDPQLKCTTCNFTAMNLTGLKAHMRIHPCFKCSYCTFAGFTRAEVWEHWERNHPFVSFKFENVSTIESSNESGSSQLDKKLIIDDYSDDIEEEQVSDQRDDESIYCCFYCSFRSKVLEEVQGHWHAVHDESKSSSDSPKLKSNCPFRYKEIRLSSEKTSMKAQCSKTEESPYELYLQSSHGDAQTAGTASTKQEGWICQWCNELCDSEVKMKTHHGMFHSHLPLNFKKQEKNKGPRGYVCPECPFTATFINLMKNHVSKHINLFKCKYCDETFSSSTHVATHNAREHPGLELKIESIQNYEAQVEKIMAKVKWQKTGEDVANWKAVLTESPKKNNAVARKSTATPTVRSSLAPYKVKAVARKSTNPHSRFLTNSRLNKQLSPMKSKQFSYYGIPRSPVNLAKLNTYMVVGGHRMKVNCTTLAQLINIDPKIVLQDIKYNRKKTRNT